MRRLATQHLFLKKKGAGEALDRVIKWLQQRATYPREMHPVLEHVENLVKDLLTTMIYNAIIATSMQLQDLDDLTKKDRSISPIEKTIGAWEARRRFGQVLEEAFYQKDYFVVERSGRPMAVIVPVDEYQKWQRLAKERVFTMLEEVWKRTEDMPAEKLEADIEQALEALREKLSAKGKSQPES